MNFVQTPYPVSLCPGCDAELDLATGHVPPIPGSYTICVYCGHLGVFTEDLMIRNPTKEELDIAYYDKPFREYIEAACKLIGVPVPSYKDPTSD